jgi:nicotinate-nucleotide pyrophosphorylase (carboxylating)
MSAPSRAGQSPGAEAAAASLDLVRMALAEDVGAGDVTTESCIDPMLEAEAVIVAKARGVLAGLEVARIVFAEVDAAVRFVALAADGDAVTPDHEVVRLNGPARAILIGERTALNFLQRLSGVATRTRAFVDRLAGTSTVLLDTRKTTPGMRLLEKAAVVAGGGANHRVGLFDMVLIKDNHIRAAGGLTAAVLRARAHAAPGLLIEAEAATYAEVVEACAAGVDRLLLDNMTTAEVARALTYIDGLRVGPDAPRRPLVEVSGGMTLETARPMAELGVDFISVGGLTHSAPALDLSLEIVRLG